MLSHEKLDVYHRSIEFLACALKIAETLPGPGSEVSRAAQQWSAAPSWTSCASRSDFRSRVEPSEIAPGSRRRDAQQDVVSADADEDEDEDGYDDEDGARRN
jgi:hypothetical protein